MVATPIGNLKDITIRALETLREVDMIICEDTRHSLRLLNAFEIKKPLISCHGYNEERAAQRIIGELMDGKNLAYISDAGTPGVSDPGGILASLVHKAGFQVVPIPGPSALAAMISIGAVPGKRICFDGFLSPKSGRRKNQLKELLSSGEICIVYESPFRILALLSDLTEVEPNCQCVIGRELTKIHEEVLRGSPEELRLELEGRPAIKGEFAVLMHPPLKKAEKARLDPAYFKEKNRENDASDPDDDIYEEP